MIFDLWGTLVDPFPDHLRDELMGPLAAAVGADPDEFVLRWSELYDDRMRGGTIEEHLALVSGAEDVSAAAALRREQLRRLVRPRDGVEETLAALRARGRKLGLISVCSIDVAEAWTALALDFDVEVFSCSEPVAKPDPRVFVLAAERLGVDPERSLFVDDVVANLEGAEQAGMTGVLIGPGEWPRRIERVADVLRYG